MKQTFFTHGITLLLSAFLFLGCQEQPNTTRVDAIRLNSLGYLPDGNKMITIVADICNQVNIRNANDGSVAFEAEITGPYNQIDTNLVFWKADFSSFDTPGEYYLEIPTLGRSEDFSIASDVYTFGYYTSMRAFYLWRCGMAVEGVHRGDTFRHAACHLEDGYLDYTEFGNRQKDGTGGWHDAGDYGKYVTNAGITLANLFLAWQQFGTKLENISLDLPETAPGFPEYLQELKWETDYLLKMEYPDGSGRVSHKLTRTNFSGFIMPEDDDAKRFFTSWGTNAVANFAASLAFASRIFEPYSPAYADTCLQAAKRAYAFLEKTPEYVRWQQDEFKTGGYQTNDKGGRLWAAAELWEVTGEKKYLTDFEQQAVQFESKIDLNWDWGNIKNLGMFTYLLSEKEGKDNTLEQEIRNSLINIANEIVQNTQIDVFARPFDRYYWGCNGTIARLAITLNVADELESKPVYVDAARDILAHLYGRNYYGRSFVTGLGINPPMFPHSRRSGADDVAAPWPGYLVGGGHSPTDWVDEQRSFSHNEIAINWQAPLVFLMAWFAE